MSDSSGSGNSDFRINASFFSRISDVVPVSRTITVDKLLHSLVSRIWMPVVAGDIQARKHSSPVMSGATFRGGATRCRDEVTGVEVALVDIDNKIKVHTGNWFMNRDGTPSDRPVINSVASPNPVSFDEALDAMQRAGICGVASTTLSHCDALHRVRLYIPLARPIPPSCWPQAAGWILEELGLVPRLDCVDLPLLYNPAGIGLLPTPPLKGPLLRGRVDGRVLQVPLDQIRNREILKLSEPEWQRALRQDRLRRNATKPRLHPIWCHVCDPADLLQELGCQVYLHRPWAHGTKRRTTCPWACEHSGGLDDDSGVLFYPINGRPFWRCAHSGHAHLGISDLFHATGRI